MVSDLEVLILIPAANKSNECLRSQTSGVVRTSSSADSNDVILSPPNYAPPPPTGLCLMILSRKVTGLVTRRSPGGWQPSLGMSPTYCQEAKYSSHFGCTVWMDLSSDPSPHISAAPSTKSPEKARHNPSLDAQTICRPVWQTHRPPSETFVRVKSWLVFPQTGQNLHCSSSV